MKPLLVLARITLVGCLWSIIFIEGVRVIVLENWRFDIFWPPHWAYAYNLWMSGWVIDTPKEWAFILILLAFIPLWLTGWIALSLVPWEKIIYKIATLPFRLVKGSVEPLKYVAMPTPVIQKKKSYKEVRPTSKRVPIYDYGGSAQTQAPIQIAPSSTPVVALPNNTSNPTKNRAAATREALNHTIFDLDEGDEDFDLDIDSFDRSDIFKIDSQKNKKQAEVQAEYDFDDEEAYQTPAPQPSQKKKFDFDDDDVEEYRPKKSEPRQRRNRNDDDRRKANTSRRENRDDRAQSHLKTPSRTESERSGASNATVSMLEDKGYIVFKNLLFDRTKIDYVGASSDTILLCFFDNEPGDWLADEERFNDEEPLWFSENSHRISPVRKAEIAREILENALQDSDLDCAVKPYVIETNANIINAEDMLDIWNDMDIRVVRTSKGGPVELEPFAKAVPVAEESLSRDDLAELKRLLKPFDARKN